MARIKKLVFGLIGLFVIFFLFGFLDIGGMALLITMLLYFAIGVALISYVIKSKARGKLRVYLLIAAISSLVFACGVSYGIMGILRAYRINDSIYISSVTISAIGFIAGGIGSLVLLKSKQPE